MDFIYYHIFQAVKMNLKIYPGDMVEYVTAIKGFYKAIQKKTTVSILLMKNELFILPFSQVYDRAK